MDKFQAKIEKREKRLKSIRELVYKRIDQECLV